jgi:hypothetical protein
LRIIEDLKSGLDAWDFQLEFAISAQHGLQVIPSKSMVCNIGFGSEASHTQKLPRGIKNLSHFSTIFPIVHPTLMMPDAGYERRLLDLDKPSPWARVKLVIKSLLRVYFNLK